MTRDLRVCFVGDSFVAGVGDPEHLGWTGRLCAGSERDGLSLTGYVLGVRRQTSAEVAARWAAECRARLGGGTWESRVVVSMGVNDTGVVSMGVNDTGVDGTGVDDTGVIGTGVDDATEEDGASRLSPQRSVAALGEVLGGAVSAGWPVLVVGPPAVADDAQNARTAALDERFARVCAEHGVPHVPVLAALAADPTWTREVAAGDGAHPGAAGYAVLAELVRPHWTAWLAARR